MASQNTKSLNTMPPGHQDKRQVSDPLVHHLYFDDNDSFFPPSWLGKEDASQRRFSKDSTASNDADIKTSKPEQCKSSHE